MLIHCFQASKNSVVNRLFPKAKPGFNLKTFKRITVIVITVLILGALAAYQRQIFLLGFAIGLAAQVIFPKQCSQAIKKIIDLVKKHPIIALGMAAITTAIVPQWLLVGPFIMAGLFAGAKAVQLFQQKKRDD